MNEKSINGGLNVLDIEEVGYRIAMKRQDTKIVKGSSQKEDRIDKTINNKNPVGSSITSTHGLGKKARRYYHD